MSVSDKEIESPNKQGLKTILEGFAQRIELFTRMPDNSSGTKREAADIIGFLNETFYQKRDYFMKKYGLGRFDDSDHKIKKILKKEDLFHEPDPPEEIRLITNFSNRESVLEITYPSGQKYFLGFKENGDRIIYFSSIDKDQQKIVSFKFRVLKEGEKRLLFSAGVYEKGKIIHSGKVHPRTPSSHLIN